MSKYVIAAGCLLAAAMLGGVVAWTRSDPFKQELVFPIASAPPPPMTVEYHGDKLDVLRRSHIAASLSGSGRAALLVLGNADVFATPYVYAAGALSPHAVAFRRLLREPAALLAFAELSRADNPAAALYGLCGLYLLDPVAYSQAARRLERSGMHFNTLNGCIGGSLTIAQLLEAKEGRWNIGSGTWPKALAGRE